MRLRLLAMRHLKATSYMAGKWLSLCPLRSFMSRKVWLKTYLSVHLTFHLPLLAVREASSSSTTRHPSEVATSATTL